MGSFKSKKTNSGSHKGHHKVFPKGALRSRKADGFAAS
jgi:hypothetical protein